MKFGADIRGPQGMDLNYFGNPLTFPPGPRWGSHECKRLHDYWMDYREIRHGHSCPPRDGS